MSKYYLLRLASDLKEIGVKNGIKQVAIHEDGFTDKLLYKKIFDFFCGADYWVKTNKQPNFGVELQCLEKLEDAILTDFLSFGPVLLSCPFLISLNVEKCFAKFRLQEHYFYDAKVFDKKSIFNYKLFYCPTLPYASINFEQSIFYSGSLLSGKAYCNLSNEAELLDYSENNSANVRAEKIVLADDFDRNLDLFSLKFGGVFVSERLKEALESFNFTGIKMVPCVGDSPSVLNLE